MVAIVKKIKFKMNKVRVQIDAELRNDEYGRRVLSIVGDVHDCACGQCQDTIRDMVEKGIETDFVSTRHSKDQILKLLNIWDRWHRNHMQAGTPRQMAILRPWFKAGGYKDYKEQLAYLASHELLVDNGYKYGTAWLYEPLPDEVIEFISGL